MHAAHFNAVPTRISISTLGGALITAGLFTLMQALISQPTGLIPDIQTQRFISTIRVKPEPLEPIRNKRTKPPEPEDSPPLPTLPPSSFTGPGDGVIPISPVRPPIEGPEGINRASNEPIAIVKVQPTYPNRAAAQGIEGWVLVEYTVTTLGTVSDIRILDAEPKGVFDRSAINSVGKWRYQPREVNGKAIAVAGIKQMLTFELKD